MHGTLLPPMNQERPREEPDNTLVKTFSREGWVTPVHTLIIHFYPLFYPLFCLDTRNSRSSDFPAVSNLPSLCNSLHVCTSAHAQQGTGHGKHAQCPELAGDRDREINRAICPTQDSSLKCSPISLPRTNSPSLSITIPFFCLV